MLSAQLHVEASSEQLLQACSRIYTKANRPDAPARRRSSSDSRTGRSVDLQQAEQDQRSSLQQRRDSGQHASTSQHRGPPPLYAAAEQTAVAEPPEGPRDDDVLPDSLSEALEQAATSTQLALDGPGGRYLVEILVPEFWSPSSGAIFSEEGDQQRFWRMTKKYAETLCAELDGRRLKVLYPDAGTAAMLSQQWPDAGFSIASIKDRSPVDEEDEVVLLAAPDPQSLNESRRIADTHDEGKHVIMFNPRLMSFDVGVGLASRRLRDQFLATFQTTYALRPVGQDASVYRRYPDQWKVFVADPDTVGRYLLAAQMAAPPPVDAVNEIVRKATRSKGPEGEEQPEGLLSSVGARLGSFSRFLSGLSR